MLRPAVAATAFFAELPAFLALLVADMAAHTGIVAGNPAAQASRRSGLCRRRRCLPPPASPNPTPLMPMPQAA